MGAKSFFTSTPIVFDGTSRTCPMLASTKKSFPKNRLIVFAFVGLSTITKCFPMRAEGSGERRECQKHNTCKDEETRKKFHCSFFVFKFFLFMEPHKNTRNSNASLKVLSMACISAVRSYTAECFRISFPLFLCPCPSRTSLPHWQTHLGSPSALLLLRSSLSRAPSPRSSSVETR